MGNTTLEKPIVKEREFTFDPKEHVYKLDGKRMYGTTTILSVVAKPALIGWAANCAVDFIEEEVRRLSKISDSLEFVKALGDNWASILIEAKRQHTKKKEQAGELGTDVHAQIEAIINTAINDWAGYVQATKTDNKQVQKFVAWAIDKNVKFLASEQRLYSESMWVAGTADFICEIDGKLYIGDVKTSSAIYPEHMWQASAYAKMAEEMGMYENFHGVVIVNVPKKGGLNVKENYDLKGNQKAFEACLTIYKQKESEK